MEDRREEIRKLCQEIFDSHFIEVQTEVLQFYEKNEDRILEELKEPLNKLFRKAGKKKVKFMAIGFLYSSLMTDSRKYSMILYNELFYLDLGAVSENVKFQFLDPYFNGDVKSITDLAGNKFLRMTEYEKAAVKAEWGLQYLKILSACLKKLMLKVSQLETFVQMERDNDFKVILGEYMGQGKVIYGKQNLKT